MHYMNLLILVFESNFIIILSYLLFTIVFDYVTNSSSYSIQVIFYIFLKSNFMEI